MPYALPINKYEICQVESKVRRVTDSPSDDRYEKGVLHNLSAAMKPLVVKYDYAKAAKTLTRESLKSRPNTLWKWREILPVTKTENCVYLGEECAPTPLPILPGNVENACHERERTQRKI
eukprot:4423717-Pyramimonas_sp.AAC.2